MWSAHTIQSMNTYIMHIERILNQCTTITRNLVIQYLIHDWLKYSSSGFGGLEVSMLARPKPSDFSDVKILSMPTFGGEVKQSVPCPNFGAYKRTQQLQFITGCWQNSYVQFPSFANRGLSRRTVRSASGDEGRNYSDQGHKGPVYKA
jgi:hypothetical protein